MGTTSKKFSARFAGQHIDETALCADVCRESFYDFVKQFWSTVIAEKPVWNWHIEYICERLQNAAERVFADLPCLADEVINVPPGSSKSTIASVMFPAWVWTRMPSARFICVSYADTLALDLSVKSRQVVLSEKYQRCFPNIKLKGDLNTKSEFGNTHHGFRFAAGTGGMITGRHAHFIITDDPIDPRGAHSEADLKSVNRWTDETLSTRKVSKTVSVMFTIMQRLSQQDPTAHRIEKKGAKPVNHTVLPAEDKYDVKPESLRAKYVNGLLDPVRMPTKILKEQEAELGQYGYAGQYGQSPIPPGGGMFQVGRIKIRERHPSNTYYKRFCRFWDKAGTEDAGCNTAGVLMAEDRDGFFWIMDCDAFQKESWGREERIEQNAKIDGKHVEIGIEQEPGSGGKFSGEYTIRRLAGYRCFMVQPGKKSKVQRADPFSVQVNAGNVFMCPGEWNKALIEELKYFPFGKMMDRVDACSGAFNRLTGSGRRVGSLDLSET